MKTLNFKKIICLLMVVVSFTFVLCIVNTSNSYASDVQEPFQESSYAPNTPDTLYEALEEWATDYNIQTTLAVDLFRFYDKDNFNPLFLECCNVDDVKNEFLTDFQSDILVDGKIVNFKTKAPNKDDIKVISKGLIKDFFLSWIMKDCDRFKNVHDVCLNAFYQANCCTIKQWASESNYKNIKTALAVDLFRFYNKDNFNPLFLECIDKYLIFDDMVTNQFLPYCSTLLFDKIYANKDYGLVTNDGIITINNINNTLSDIFIKWCKSDADKSYADKSYTDKSDTGFCNSLAKNVLKHLLTQTIKP